MNTFGKRHEHRLVGITRRSSRMVMTLVFAAVIAIPESAEAQSEFAAVSAKDTNNYRFNFGNVYRNDEARRATLDSLSTSLARIEGMQGAIGSSSAILLGFLRLRDDVTRLTQREATFLRLRYSVDRRRVTALDSIATLVGMVNRRLAFAGPELLAIQQAQLSRWMNAEPALARYAYALRPPRPQRGRLSEAESVILNELEPLTANWVAEHYDALGRPDSLASIEREVAFGLRHLTRAGNAVARIRGFKSAPDAAYRSNALSLASVDSLVTRIATISESAKRFERVIARRLRTVTGREKLNFYADIVGSAESAGATRLNIDAATRAISAALTPLGPAYNKALRLLLDPKQGRLDIVGGPNRVQGGFAVGFPGATPGMIYMRSFEGTMRDVITLAHEAGHVVQFDLMAESRVPATYAQAPNYLTESFAQFNELLLLDYLSRSSDSSARTFYLEQFLYRTLHEIFAQARAVAFENAMYSQAETDGALSAADLNQLMRQVGNRYSIWFGGEDDTMRDWIRIPHYSRNPFYRVNYLYGRLLALAYFDQFTRDSGTFVPKYVALLRNGYDAPPDDLLRKFLGIELHSPQLLDRPMGMLMRRVDALEARYE
jgi:oligoendopeptidase F